MYFFARLFCVPLILAGLFAASAKAQRGGLNDAKPVQEFSTSYQTAPGTAVLVFKVFSERSTVHLDRQALVKLVNLADQTATWQTTEDTYQGVFTNVAYGSYNVEVSAVGYLSAHQELQVASSQGPLQIEIVLHRDPEAINLDVVGAVMSPKARKETKRAVSALKSGNLKEAEKQLGEAYKLSPSSSDLNFLLGYLYFQKKDFAQAGTYLGTATTLNPHNAPALTLLGRTGLERQDYPAARSALEQAVMADAENWLPHNLLADAYLRQQDYDKALDEAQVAITKGKGVASPAQLVLGQALVGLGRNQEGIQALNVFLQQSPQHPMAGQVRTLIAEIESAGTPEHEAGPSPLEGAGKTETHLSGVDALGALPEPGLSVKSWQPPGVDEVQLALAPGVACPSDKVVEESGKRVQELI
jgi:cytochrome c-type biogenesis protein CcmH/NrfG